MKQSLFRKLTYIKLSQVKLTGAVLDVGGVKDAEYHKIINGKSVFTTANIDESTHPDILIDLEGSRLPIENETYDSVILINLLEHIYNYNFLIKESSRILKQNGKIVIVVPFLYYVHSSPNDYFRYTKQALEMIMKENSFDQIKIEEIGCGAFSASANLIHRFFPSFVNLVIEKIAVLFDKLVIFISKILKKIYVN